MWEPLRSIEAGRDNLLLLLMMMTVTVMLSFLIIIIIMNSYPVHVEATPRARYEIPTVQVEMHRRHQVAISGCAFKGEMPAVWRRLAFHLAIEGTCGMSLGQNVPGVDDPRSVAILKKKNE